MGKIEKLKEINKIIKDKCVNLETRIFIENIDDYHDERIIKEYQLEDVVIKQ